MPLVRPHESYLFLPLGVDRIMWNREVSRMGAKSKASLPRNAPRNAQPFVVPKNVDLEPFDEYLDDPMGMANDESYVRWRERLSGLQEAGCDEMDAYAAAEAARGSASTTSDMRNFKDTVIALWAALKDDGYGTMPLISVEPHYGEDKGASNNTIWTCSDGIWRKGVNAFMSLLERYDLPEGKSHEEARRVYHFLCSMNSDYAGGQFAMRYFSAATWVRMRDLLDDCVYPHQDCLFNYATGERTEFKDAGLGATPIYVTQRSDTPAPHIAMEVDSDTGGEIVAGREEIDIAELRDDFQVPTIAAIDTMLSVLKQIRESPEYAEVADIFGNPKNGYFPEALALEEVMQRYGVGIMRRLFHVAMKEAVFLFGHGHNAKTEIGHIITFAVGAVWSCPIRDAAILQPQKRGTNATAAKPEWHEHLWRRFSPAGELVADNCSCEIDAGIVKPRVGGENQTFRLMKDNGDPAPPWTSLITVGGNTLPTIVGGTDSRTKNCVKAWEMVTTYVDAANMELARTEGRLRSGQQFNKNHLKLFAWPKPHVMMEQAPQNGLAYKHAILLYIADWSEVHRIRESVSISVSAAQEAGALPPTEAMRKMIETGVYEPTFDWETLLAPGAVQSGDFKGRQCGLNDYEWGLLSSLMLRAPQGRFAHLLPPGRRPLVPKILYSVIELLNPSEIKSESSIPLDGSNSLTAPEELFWQVFTRSDDPSDIMFLKKKGERASAHGSYGSLRSMIDAYNTSPWTAGHPELTSKDFVSLFNKFCANPADPTKKNGGLPGRRDAPKCGTEEKPLVQYRSEFGEIVQFIKPGPGPQEALIAEMQGVQEDERALQKAKEAKAKVEAVAKANAEWEQMMADPVLYHDKIIAERLKERTCWFDSNLEENFESYVCSAKKAGKLVEDGGTIPLHRLIYITFEHVHHTTTHYRTFYTLPLHKDFHRTKVGDTIYDNTPQMKDAWARAISDHPIIRESLAKMLWERWKPDFAHKPTSYLRAPYKLDIDTMNVKGVSEAGGPSCSVDLEDGSRAADFLSGGGVASRTRARSEASDTPSKRGLQSPGSCRSIRRIGGQTGFRILDRTLASNEA